MTAISVIREYLAIHLPMPIQVAINFLIFPIAPAIAMCGLAIIIEFLEEVKDQKGE